MLDYINYIPQAERAGFIAKLQSIATALGTTANNLMTVFFAESKVNPKAYNSASGASGLIQFLPSTASRLGTTTAAIRSMTATQQLDWVYKYYKSYTGKLKTVYDTYLAVFYPVAIGKPDSYILFSKGSTAYSQNSNLDTDKNGNVTVGNVKTWFSKYIQSATATNYFLIIIIVAITLLTLKYYHGKR